MNMMTNIFAEKENEISALYAKCVQSSNRINWDLDENDNNGRIFDVSALFLLKTLQGIKE